jgi:LMBR1 domain-containing protein 1
VGLQKSIDTTVKVATASCIRNDTYLEIAVSLPIFTIGFISFISWFFFIIFGGIGLPSLPLDLIYDFITRPKKIPKSELKGVKAKLADQADAMSDLALEAKDLESNGVKTKSFLNKDKRKYKDVMKKLRAGCLILDKQYMMIQLQEELNDSWVLHYYLGLFLGIIFTLISLTWVTHM